MDFLASPNQCDNYSPAVMASHDLKDQLWLCTVAPEILTIVCRGPGSLRLIENYESVCRSMAILVAVFYESMYLPNPRPYRTRRTFLPGGDATPQSRLKHINQGLVSGKERRLVLFKVEIPSQNLHDIEAC